MPALYDLMDNKVLGRESKRGYLKGILEGELTMLRLLIEKRFGPIPDWAEERLAVLSKADIEKLGLRVLDARSIEDLLG